MFAFAQALSANPSLTELGVWNTAVTNSGVAALASALTQPGCVLVNLLLGGNSFGPPAVEELCRSLMQNRSLSWLDLSGNKVGRSCFGA